MFATISNSYQNLYRNFLRNSDDNNASIQAINELHTIQQVKLVEEIQPLQHIQKNPQYNNAYKNFAADFFAYNKVGKTDNSQNVGSNINLFV